MTLTLTVLRCPPNVAPEVRQVTGGEYSIGRGPDNDWVLPDPARHLSKRHCVIAYRQGAWQVAGTSTNGTFINRETSPLEARAPHTLTDGDRLILGVYEIEVQLTDETAAAQSRGQPASKSDSPFGSLFDDDIFAPAPSPSPPRSTAGSGHDLGPFASTLPETFDPLRPDEDDDPYPETREDHSPAISDAISLPHTQSRLPDDWDLDDPSPGSPPKSRQIADPGPVIAPSIPVPSSSVSVPVAAMRPAAAADLLAAFLRGAGLEAIDVPDPARTMERLGAAFRAVVSGIRQALIARSEVKRAFRIEETLVRRGGNNMLKFSANDDDALTGLLGAGRYSDMGADEAITDALTNIRLHELATMTAMQSAVRALVMRLGPDQIRDPKESGGGMPLLSNRKARAWDAYEALHADILRNLSDDFDSVFGKRFALAYEQAMQEQLARPKNRRDNG
jgi:type VI secretion system FHA domain protein